jgi:hypothetical protein
MNSKENKGKAGNKKYTTKPKQGTNTKPAATETQTQCIKGNASSYIYSISRVHKKYSD